jgi:hypothetical protein
MSEIEVHIDLSGVVHRVGTLRVQARNVHDSSAPSVRSGVSD